MSRDVRGSSGVWTCESALNRRDLLIGSLGSSRRPVGLQPLAEAQPPSDDTDWPFALRVAVDAELRALKREAMTRLMVSIAYPMGDVPDDRGVRTDTVIRAFRHAGVDLQEAVHKDMVASFSAYPKTWGLTRPDTNIDHRRVPNLETFFKRRAGEDAVQGRWRLSAG